MLVLHVIESLGAGGAERQLVQVVRSTAPAGIAHRVVQLGDRRHFVEELQELGASVDSLGLRGRWAPFAAVAPLRRLVARIRPDVVHSWLFPADVAARLALVGARPRRLVSSVQAPQHEPSVWRAAGWSTTSCRLRLALDAATARAVHPRFVACSNYVAESTVRRLHVASGDVTMIYNDVTPPRATAAAAAAVRRELGAGPDAVVFMTVARLERQKAPDDLIHAFAALENPETLLVIVGDGPLRAEMEALAERAGAADRIIFTGVRSDVPALLAAADAFVLPSRFEGLGIALLEAMAAGLPSIATQIPPFREIVAGQDTAILIPVGDTDALRGAMARLAADPQLRVEMGRRARHEVGARFSPAATLPQWLALYEAA